MAGRDFKIKPVTRFVNGPDRMTAEWPLQGNSCMQDCQIPGGRARRARAGAPLAPCAWLLGALQPPLFYCSFSMKERNLFFCLGQGNNKRWLKRRLASEATEAPQNAMDQRGGRRSQWWKPFGKSGLGCAWTSRTPPERGTAPPQYAFPR